MRSLINPTPAGDWHSVAVCSDGQYGIDAGLGYFSFRDSLFVDIDPDPPGNLSDDWGEIYIKPWISLEVGLGNGELFGKASFAYTRTGDDAAEIAGRSADSWDFDALYLGWRYGEADQYP